MIFDSECHAGGRHTPKPSSGPAPVPKIFDAKEMEGFPPGTESVGRDGHWPQIEVWRLLNNLPATIYSKNQKGEFHAVHT